MSMWLTNISALMPSLIKQAKIMVQNYNVVVTNPPYMGASGMNSKLTEYVKKNYTDSKADLYACLIEKSMKMAIDGYISMVTMHSWMFLSSFEKLREHIVKHKTIISVLHLGMEAFDDIIGKVVSTVAFVINPIRVNSYKLHAVRLVDFYDSKRYLKKIEFYNTHYRYMSCQDNFKKIPGTPIAYWVSERFLLKFENNANITQFSDYTASQNKTANNEKYVRLWWEVDFNFRGKKWFPYSKGGEYRKHYGNIFHVVDWSDDARKYYKNNPTSNLLGEKYWNQSGIAYTDITTRGCSFRYFEGGAFDMSGPVITFVSDVFYFMGLLNSKPFQYYAHIANPTFHLQAKDVKGFPILDLVEEDKNTIRQLEEQNTSISKTDWFSFETGWNFEKHPLIQHKASSGEIKDAFDNWKEFTANQFTQLKTNEEELNRIFIEIYGLQDELLPEVEDKDVTVRKADLQRDIRSFVSYLVGCVLGRYSPDVEGLAYAGGDWDNSKYKTLIPDKDNVILIPDDEFFDDDIVVGIVKYVKVVYGEDTLEENLEFIASALGNKGRTSREVIRNYFLKDFYKDHVKTYQKRPIYWLFDSGKENGFKALIYLHRYNEDTVGRVRADYLHKTQAAIENAIANCDVVLESNALGSDKAKAVKLKEKLVVRQGSSVLSGRVKVLVG